MKTAAIVKAFILILILGAYSCCLAQDQPEVVGSYDPLEYMITNAILNGRTVQCVIDTGASHHAIDSSLKPILGRCRPYSYDEKIEVCGPQNLIVGDMRDSASTVSAVVDLTPIRSVSGVDFQMVLGRPFLIGKVLEIDPNKRRFRIHTTEVENGDETLELQLGPDGEPLVSIAIADLEVQAIVDTGSNTDVTLERSLFEQIESLALRTGNGKPVTRDIFRLTERIAVKEIENCSVRIGRYTIDSCSITEGGSNKIGFGLLSRLLTIIDLKNMRLILSRPSENSHVNDD